MRRGSARIVRRNRARDLKHQSVLYRPADLRAWQAGRYQVLKQSRASEFIKQILFDKARRRREARVASGKGGDRRFFGEAVVAAHPAFAHRAGWYGSFKWLSAPAWCAATESSLFGYRDQFRAALDKYVLNLRQVQSREKLLHSLLGDKHAVAPDLWLFTGREHRFIEVKLPGDRLRDSQLAGLALIASCLKSARPVSVEVVSVVADSVDGCRLSEGERERFKSFCEALTAAWRWREGGVDCSREHIEIRIGDASRSEYEQWVPVALVGRPVRSVFPVQWLINPDGQLATEVRRELDFYLIEHPAKFSGTGDPWAYAVYHCGTGANMYSSVHWSHFPEGSRGDRHSSTVVKLTSKEAAKLFPR
jgi:hypothetical protein